MTGLKEGQEGFEYQEEIVEMVYIAIVERQSDDDPDCVDSRIVGVYCCRQFAEEALEKEQKENPKSFPELYEYRVEDWEVL